MRRLRISGQVISGCIACCAAASFMIGLATMGRGDTGVIPRDTRASVATRRQLDARAALPTGILSSKSLRVSEQYRQFPLSFEPNRDQTNNSDVKFLARGEGYILFLTGKEAVFSMGKTPKTASVLRMSLVGANAQPAFSGVDELPGKSNYFIGNQPEKWRTNIPNYGKVAEHGVYPGIDLVYYGTQRQLEYDFVIAPGSSPSKIKIAFNGARNLRTDTDGDLVLSVAGNDDVRLHRPIAYQQNGADKQLVAANYVLTGKNSIEFAVGTYDASRPLIVDPILAYSTYLGGSGIDTANAIAVAPDNTAFVAGSTFSTDFPTIHALQPNDGGGVDFPQDAFVAKISADGSTLLYATYLGGKNEDTANGIAVDTFGNAYVVGSTVSPNFPVGPFSINTLCGGDGRCGSSWNTLGLVVTNGFVTKLNAAGSGILYSGFIGEYDNVFGQAIAVDGNFNAYVTGIVSPDIVPTVPIIPPAEPPPPFPITGSAFQPAIVDGGSAYIMKIDATGGAILYSSYLGGDIEDIGYGIALDSSANAYVTGLTNSTTFPTTAGALQGAFGGAGDAFVSKINPNAFGPASLVYSTYLGGSGLDQGSAIAVDKNGNAYVTGQTSSTSFGFTPTGTFQTANHGEGDAFVAKLTTTGALSYFTYLGGSLADAGTGIALDAAGDAYVTGSTVSTDFPTAGAVFQPTYGGGNADSFVAKLDPAGATLLYSSFLGGTNTELATGIAVDTANNAYVTGQTCSEDFPLANPLQVVPGGNCDAYVAKVSILAGFAINPAGLVFSAQSLNTSSQPETVVVTNGDNPQTINSIALTGPNAGDFSETTTCPVSSSFAVGGTCAITVSFSPTGQGIRKAAVTIIDTAPGSPHVINLTGNTSTVTLSVSSLAFGPQNVGTSSAPQPVTVTNSGTTPLTIASIAASGDFSETDNCTKAPLQPRTNCGIQVTFSPSTGASSIGAITITDNGSGSPQVILVTGTGIFLPPFQISSLSPPAAVPAGQTANYAISVLSGNGFSQPVTLSCIAPSTLACAISPNVVTPTTSASPAAVLTVSTSLRTSVPPGTGLKVDPFSTLRNFHGTWLLWLAAILMALATAAIRRRPVTATFGFAVVLLLASVACSGTGKPGVPAGTPAGSYQITVRGTSGTSSSATTLNLQVN